MLRILWPLVIPLSTSVLSGRTFCWSNFYFRSRGLFTRNTEFPFGESSELVIHWITAQTGFSALLEIWEENQLNNVRKLFRDDETTDCERSRSPILHSGYKNGLKLSIFPYVEAQGDSMGPIWYGPYGFLWGFLWKRYQKGEIDINVHIVSQF